MNQVAPSPSRRRGRDAKRISRIGAISHVPDIVGPGLRGGSYKPLTDAQMDTIIDAAKRVLEDYGMADATPAITALLLSHGARQKGNRIAIPREMVDAALETACRSFDLYGIDGEKKITLGGDHVNFGTNSYVPSVRDMETGEFRNPTVTDLYDLTRLADKLDNYHYVRIPVIARDLSPDEFDVNSAYAVAMGTGKPLGIAVAGSLGTAASLASACELDRPVRLADGNWDAIQVFNSIAAVILEEGYGCETEMVTGGMVPLFTALGKNDIDIFMDVWIPNNKEIWEETSSKGAVELGVMYPDATEGWYVPRYVVEGDAERGIEPDQILARAEILDLVSAGPIDEDIAPRAAAQLVIAGATVERVVSRLPVEFVIPSAAAEQVVPGSALDFVVSAPTVDGVVAKPAK
jgi:hypothetical protein